MKARWAIISIFSCFLFTGAAGLLPFRFGADVRRATVPIFLGNDGPSALLKIESIRSDYQRKGFFRIGVLPQIVVEGVQITLFRRDDYIDSLLQIADSLKNPKQNCPVILRRLSLSLPDQINPRLSVASIHFSEPGLWKLIGIQFHDAGKTIEAPEGTLQLSGRRAGTLTLYAPAGILEQTLLSGKIPAAKSVPEKSDP